MSAPVVKADHLRVRLARLFEDEGDVRVVGIQSAGTWSGPDEIRVGTRQVRVRACPSVLAFREQLEDAEDDESPSVLVTPVPSSELGEDVLGRLAKHRLISIQTWDVLKDMFRVRSIDARVPTDKWFMDALLAVGDRVQPQATGVLDRDTAWRVVLEDYFGFESPSPLPDAEDVLAWSAEPSARAKWLAAAPELRDALCARLGTGPREIAGVLLRAVAGEHGGSLLPLGLAVRGLVGEDSAGSGGADDPRVAAARVRLEPVFGGGDAQQLSTEQLERWADAAEGVIGRWRGERGLVGVDGILRQSEELLGDGLLRTPELAEASAYLPRGLGARLRELATVLVEFFALEGDIAPDVLDRVERAAERAGEHLLLAEDGNRRERIDMARRLARQRFLERQEGAADAPRAKSFGEVARGHERLSSHLDRARLALADGDAHAELASAYQTILRQVGEQRERENREFARLLADETALGGVGEGLLGVERVLADVAAGVVAARPTLVLVLDGLSFAVFSELAQDLDDRGWVEHGQTPEGDDPPRRTIAVATMPSITVASRASLLAGELVTGDQGLEARRFKGHPALLEASGRKKGGSKQGGGAAPVCFHKGDLVAAGGVGLEAKVRDAIAVDGPRAVGIVINAVDDLLDKADQVRTAWRVDFITPLEHVLEAARDAGRAVLIVSDHGHVLERQGMRPLERTSKSARWRPVDEQGLDETELVIRGDRVLAPGGNEVVVPWSEQVRYGGRKNGYHGGATPQEMLVPVALFLRPDDVVEGWSPLPVATPEWWERLVPATRAVTFEPAAAPSVPVEVEEAAPGPLFEVAHKKKIEEARAAADEAPVAASGAKPLGWIGELLDSEGLADQLKQVKRGGITAERVSQVLVALEERGGKLTHVALARALGMPEFRVRGLVAQLQRVLNVDGYPVLSEDAPSSTIALDRELLRTQFGLEKEKS